MFMFIFPCIFRDFIDIFNCNFNFRCWEVVSFFLENYSVRNLELKLAFNLLDIFFSVYLIFFRSEN